MPARSAQRDRLVALLEPLVSAAGYDLEQLVVTPAGRRSLVRVVVDGDRLTLDHVAALSRHLSEALDAGDDGFGAHAYVLEVTSPGVDRPLTEARHWRRAIGRLVGLTLSDGTEVKGRLRAADEHGAVLDVGGRERTVAYPEVSKARVDVEFNRTEGASPSNTEEDSP